MKFLYTPFGEMWVEEASEVDIDHITRFFTNQQYDKESGLYYYNARYYDPHLGSFITPDPAMDGINHYAYCSANPIKYTDPTGLEDGEEEFLDGPGIAPPDSVSGDRNDDGVVRPWEEWANNAEDAWDRFNDWCNNLAARLDEIDAKASQGYNERNANYAAGRGWKTNAQLGISNERPLSQALMTLNIGFNNSPFDREYKRMEAFANSLHQHPGEYGFYGWLGYTAGHHGGGYVSFARASLNSLDELFKIHDYDYFLAQFSPTPNHDRLAADIKLLNSLYDQANKPVTYKFGNNEYPIPLGSQIHASFYIQAAITVFENKIKYYDSIMSLKEEWGF